MCTPYSAWQRLNKNRDIRAFRKRLREARTHMEFVCELYREQMNAGRLFLHEHPDSASSWTDEACIKDMLTMQSVGTTVTDQCQFGQKSKEGNPIKKPIR